MGSGKDQSNEYGTWRVVIYPSFWWLFSTANCWNQRVTCVNDTSIYQLTLGHHLLGDEFHVMSNVFQPFFRYYSITLTLHIFFATWTCSFVCSCSNYGGLMPGPKAEELIEAFVPTESVLALQWTLFAFHIIWQAPNMRKPKNPKWIQNISELQFSVFGFIRMFIQEWGRRKIQWFQVVFQVSLSPSNNAVLGTPKLISQIRSDMIWHDAMWYDVIQWDWDDIMRFHACVFVFAASYVYRYI